MIKRMESLQNQSSANEEADIYSVAVLDSGRRVLVLEMQKYTMELDAPWQEERQTRSFSVNLKVVVTLTLV